MMEDTKDRSSKRMSSLIFFSEIKPTKRLERKRETSKAVLQARYVDVVITLWNSLGIPVTGWFKILYSIHFVFLKLEFQ